MNEPHDELDLDWLAFCYAAGELDAEQAARFEALFAESQDARERLAAVVLLTEHLADAPLARPSRPRSGQVYARMAWLAAGAAMLLAAIWVGRNYTQDAGSGLPGEGDAREAELAHAWADSFIAPAGSLPDDDGVEIDSAGMTPPAFEADGDDLLDVPDWMIAALGGEVPPGEAAPEDDTSEFEEMFPEALDAESLQDG